MSRTKVIRTVTAYLFLLPLLSLFSIFVLYSLGNSFFISLHEWDGISSIKWVGLANYKKALVDPYVYSALIKTVIWTCIFTLGSVGIGLLMATLLYKGVKGEAIFKAIFYLPMIFSFPAIGLVWTWSYAPEGPLNQVLKSIGLGVLARPWLADPSTALVAASIPAIWAHTGFCMVMFLAGFRGVPTELLEVAELEGLSSWQRFRHIILPLSRGATNVVLLFTIMLGLKVFDIILTMTMGGPYRTTEVLAYLVYKTIFSYWKFGYGTTIAWILFALVFSLGILYLRRMIAREVTY